MAGTPFFYLSLSGSSRCASRPRARALARPACSTGVCVAAIVTVVAIVSPPPPLSPLSRSSPPSSRLSPPFVTICRKALYLAHNELKIMPPQTVHMVALTTLDLTGNPVEAMPSRMRRLDNMNALLHSKHKRQALIRRANHVRSHVKSTIMRDIIHPPERVAAPPAAGGGGGASPAR